MVCVINKTIEESECIFIPVNKVDDLEYFKDLSKEIDKKGGREAFLHFLLERDIRR